MKKITIIFTLAFISLISTGSFFIYTGYLISYHNDFQSYIRNEKSNLITTEISINPSQLYVNSKTISWEFNNKELIFNDVLYDIVSINSVKGKVILTVLSDSQEQEIKKQFAENYDINPSKSSSHPIKLLKQFLAFKYIAQSDESVDIIANQSSLSNYTEYFFSIIPVFLSKETLPPSFVA